MNTNTEILNELEGISAVVALLPKVNVYQVHENYFEEMQQTVLAKINNNVPEGYFENLCTSVLQKIKANEVAD